MNNRKRFIALSAALIVVFIFVGAYIYEIINPESKPIENQEATITNQTEELQVLQEGTADTEIKQEADSIMSEILTEDEVELALQNNIGGFSGVYKYQSVPNGDSVGVLDVLQTSDDEIIFSLFAGGFRDHVGIIYATKVRLNNNRAVYEKDWGSHDKNGQICKFEILFGEDKAVIKSIDGGAAGDSPCDFGAGGMANFTYPKISDNVPNLSDWPIF
jgi:hypothetical protein